MAKTGAIDLDAPFTSDTILEVRSGKIKPLRGLNILSGIDKGLLNGPVKVDKMGIIGDEHDYTFHGGVDKAIHGYCCSHYDTWKTEFPSAADAFRPGGFGENLVTARMNERNVCIGDVMAVGDELVLQVSLPRQPCFKLNHRFQLKNFAPSTWKTSRTGWYYRVLKEGTIKAGDEIRLVERKHPKWTIERIQEYLHRNKDDLAMNEELAAIEEFGVESKGAFESRVAKAKAKKDKKPKEEQTWRDFKVVEKRKQTQRIMTFVLEAIENVDDEDVEVLGSHAKIKLGNGLVRAYSIVGGDNNRLEFGIALDDKSRGGSRYLHDSVNVDDILQVGRITSAVDILTASSNHLFIVGGIGITAFLGIMEALRNINYSVELHYAVRSEDERPYKERLDKLGESVKLYDKQKGQRMDVGNVIKNMTWNSAIYVCGPKTLMDAALREVKAAGINEKEVHFEAFEADISGDPFEAVVANRNVTVKVEGEETLLEVLQRQFDDIPSSCEVGNCGTCKLTLKEGKVDHRGTALLEEEKTSCILSCVSRGIGRIVVEI